eukprot:26018_1
MINKYWFSFGFISILIAHAIIIIIITEPVTTSNNGINYDFNLITTKHILWNYIAAVFIFIEIIIMFWNAYKLRCLFAHMKIQQVTSGPYHKLYKYLLYILLSIIINWFYVTVSFIVFIISKYNPF